MPVPEGRPRRNLATSETQGGVVWWDAVRNVGVRDNPLTSPLPTCNGYGCGHSGQSLRLMYAILVQIHPCAGGLGANEIV